MSSPGVGGTWLPAHQEQALFAAAHIDSTIDALARVLEKYQRDDPVQLARRFTPTEEQVVLTGIRPLPHAVSRLFADALNQARNAIEHALFAEVVMRLDRPLTADESRSLEIPALDTIAKFEQWARSKHRASISLLGVGSDLYKRILRLQPLNRREPQRHPLRLLVEYTNFAKHREPNVAYARVGRVDRDSDLVRRPLGTRDTVKVGDVLGAVPIGSREGFSVWPEVAVQRPHTGEWETMMREVADVTDWVRLQALPILIIGDNSLPPIPPFLDITVAHEDLDAAWRAASETSAARRMQNRIGGVQLRGEVLEMLTQQFGPGSRPSFGAWLDRMDDETVMVTFWDVLEAASRGDMETYLNASDKWALDAGVKRAAD